MTNANDIVFASGATVSRLAEQNSIEWEKARVLEQYSCRTLMEQERGIWVNESTQRTKERMITATTRAIRQRKHQSSGALHRARLSSNPVESFAMNEAVVGRDTVEQRRRGEGNVRVTRGDSRVPTQQFEVYRGFHCCSLKNSSYPPVGVLCSP